MQPSAPQEFIRTKGVRKWMDGRGIGDHDLHVYCAQLARAYPFAARLNSQARHTSADRAWLSIARFYKQCREHKPGKKGYPRLETRYPLGGIQGNGLASGKRRAAPHTTPSG